MSIDETLKRMNYAHVDGVNHLYRPYARTTLCGRNKVDAPAHWKLQAPVCGKCASRLIELELAKAEVA